jgi:hypothetical protein
MADVYGPRADTLPSQSGYNPDMDPRSSNNLIHEYLAKQGLNPTAENVRRALEANARDPGMIKNEASTLYNGAPPAFDAAMNKAMAPARPLPTPPIPPGDPNTSAPPTQPPDTRPVIPRPGYNGPTPDTEPPPSALPSPPVGGPPAPSPAPLQGGALPDGGSTAQSILNGLPLLPALGAGGARLLTGSGSAPALPGPTAPLQIESTKAPPSLTAPAGAAPLAIEGTKAPLQITHDPSMTPTQPRLAAPDPLAAVHDSITQSVPGEVVPAAPGNAPAAAEAAPAERAPAKVKRVRGTRIKPIRPGV